nr:U32 family peptidase [Bacilli bacterium]
MPELLSPAGDLERLKYAILYGADAVYVGGNVLGLRANAINFTMDELKEGTKFVHDHGKKIYVTVNIVLHNKEIKLVKNYLKELESIGVDAIIVSDPLIVDTALKETNLDVHLSTQQSTLNVEACKYWVSKGVKRIVLGREVSKEEIKEIIDNVDVDIECFIHGAMCAGYSGRCVLSNYLTNRDANRGGCSQICRWDFDLLDENKTKIEAEKPFTFCTKDLSMLKYIGDMIDLGIKSFKIEGRMRSIYYLATVVSVYRKAIDDYLSGKYEYNSYLENILNRVANRDSIPQFFDGNQSKNTNYYNGRIELSNQDFLGVVKDYKDGYATIEERNYFEKGYVVEFFGPNIEPFEYTIDEILDGDNLIDVVRHPGQIVRIKIDRKLSANDIMRIKVDK